MAHCECIFGHICSCSLFVTQACVLLGHFSYSWLCMYGMLSAVFALKRIKDSVESVE